MKAPHPRYRLYTSWQSYMPFLKNVFMQPNHSEFNDRFEAELRTFLNVENLATTPMCRTAIYLALKHLIQSGQDVVMSPYTIADVVNMVILAGGRPVFADIEPSSCNISLAAIDRLIHANTGAVLVTHLHGVHASIKEICDLCKSKGVPVVEDAAQAFGASVEGKRLGTFADVGVYSFGMYKNINAWYGGAVTCKNANLLQAMKKESDSWPFQSKALLVRRMLQGLITDMATYPLTFGILSYWIFRYGRLYDIKWINRFVETELDLSLRGSMPINFLGRMTAAQCQLSMLQLPHIDRHNQIRIEKASEYRLGLQDIGGMVLPPTANGDDIYTYFPIQYGSGQVERKRLLYYLARHGCDIGPQHLKNCADEPAFKDYYRDCPNARKTSESVVLLPTYPGYPHRNIGHNIAVLQTYALSHPA